MEQITSKDHFEQVLKDTPKVMFDFWASWCGPCRTLSPVLDEVATEQTDFKVMGIDVDQHPDLAQRFGIRGIPTMLFFKGGEIKATMMGSQQKAAILKQISSII